MKNLFLIALPVLSLIIGTYYYSSNNDYISNLTKIDSETIEKWIDFKEKYGKRYADPDYEAYRIQVFKDNLERVKGKQSMGITKFMDLSPSEFQSIYLTLQNLNEGDDDNSNEKLNLQRYQHEIDTNYKSQYIDWEQEGKTSVVKNQGQCGSCWSFSSTGSIESALIIFSQESNTISLSEQELIDCSKSYGSKGCSGGIMSQGYQYVKAHKLSTEDEYPYTANDDYPCKDTSSFKKYSISGYKKLKQGSCESISQALNQQPVALSVDATNWQFYSGGVFSNCRANLNHGVLLAGFVQQENQDVWKVKNSWGTDWGNSGYIYLKNGNTCGICKLAFIPQV